MDIHSLMNTEPSAARDQPKRTPSHAPPPPPPSQQHQQQQHPYQQHRAPSFPRPSTEHHSPPPPHQPQHQHPGHPQHQHQHPPPLSHQHHALPQHPHPPAQHPHPPHHHLQSPARSSIPGYPPQPPPIDTRSPSFSHASSNPQYTPIRTPQAPGPIPGQAHTPGQYPFPPQFQSPVQTHSNRNIERVQASTPGRQAPHSYGTPQAASPSGYPPPHLPLSTPHSNASATPPSGFVQSPHAIRESPVTASHPLSHNAYSGSAYQSQPSTPLGPPPPGLPRDRSITGRPESSYGQHHRTLSGASNSGVPSIASNSPGPPQRSSSQVIESPANYGPTSAQIKRRSTDHIRPPSDREHSLSVSPKTQVIQGYPPGAQRHPSQDAWSARTSVSQGRQEIEMRHPSSDFVPPPGAAQPTTLSRQSTGPYSHGAPSPLSKAHSFHQNNMQQQSQTQPPLTNRELHHHPVREMSLDHINSPRPVSPRQKHLPEEFHHEYSREESTLHKSSVSEQRSMILQQPISRPPDAMQTESTHLKRRADDSPTIKQEQKKLRTQYSEPPPWARLHPSNPGYQGQIARYPQLKGRFNAPSTAPIKQENRGPSQPPSSSHGPPPSATHPQNTPQANGHPPPVDQDSNKKANISRILGIPWELSMTETLPADRLIHEIANFLYITMMTNPEIGAGDPRNGSLEIEAKIGTLVDKNSNDRLNLPVATPCLLEEGFSKSRVRFESFMTENQHKSFNNTINQFIKRSMEGPRVRMGYLHRYEVDSFAPLSQIGYSSLPDCAKKQLETHKPPGPLRLRTTHDNNPKLRGAPGPVLAQIVKLRLADRDIYCPSDAFDVRISINIEIDFNGRTDVDPASLSVPQSDDRDPERAKQRFKNRLSYTHLTNSIDLTQVTYDASGQGDKTHELEVEVDTKALREQAQLLGGGRDNAFEALVEKFWYDTLTLVRVREDSGN
ncbi:mRNA triphosphatase CET1 [Myriangium duriaei CBS 260.36]|uniref:mRNA-capping enzyme subunit beta n=1 Tax=Myriangium duriaei CBS 260.36 TaxID=1168546 RepID=A0A9P4MCH6_9PEZI|nr:mRNA triphosphatase CET1 [Myriangium duriaei CBS 260.36]